MMNRICNPRTLAVALYRPEIPHNTGNIGRLCVGAGSPLYIVGRPSFQLTDKYLKRAGLDYWKHVDLRQFPDFEAFRDFAGERRIIPVTKFAKKTYYEMTYREDDILLFGRETTGLPEEIHAEYGQNAVGLPMTDKVRSLNVSNTVAVVVYETLRQSLSVQTD